MIQNSNDRIIFVNFEYRGFEETILRLNAIFLDQVDERILNIFANGFYYAFYFFGENKTISVGKISKEIFENFPKNQDPFFSNISDENPPFLFREDINIVLMKETNSLNFEAYKYPFLKIEINQEIKNYDIRKDLF